MTSTKTTIARKYAIPNPIAIPTPARIIQSTLLFNALHIRNRIDSVIGKVADGLILFVLKTVHPRLHLPIHKAPQARGLHNLITNTGRNRRPCEREHAHNQAGQYDVFHGSCLSKRPETKGGQGIGSFDHEPAPRFTKSLLSYSIHPAILAVKHL